MATHYETLDIDTDASPEESELSLSILGLRSLGHRLPPVLPSPVLASGLAPYLETDIHTLSPVRKAYKKAIFRLHPDRRRKQKSHAPPNALDFDGPQLLLQASLHGTAAVMKYTPPPPEPVDPSLEKALLARFERIQAAYDILSVPEKRQAYDKEMLADEEKSLFGERKAQREARQEARRERRRETHRPAPHLPTPVSENQTNIKPPFVWDVDRKQPLFWDLNPQPNHAFPSGEESMQLIRKEDAAESSKYIFTREAAVKRLVEIDDENYGGFKFIKGVSLGAVELQSKELRVEQAKLAAAAAQLSAQMQVWPQQVNVTRKPQRPRMNNDVGRRKQDAWPTPPTQASSAAPMISIMKPIMHCHVRITFFHFPFGHLAHITSHLSLLFS